ncbi:site-specific DNA-methyltransferase, partial [Leptospira sp. id769339]
MYYNLNTDFSLKDSGYSNYDDTTSMPRHRWYYYKEGFSPRLVESAIEQSYITKKDLIIDPFNGSGTTTLTCSTNGFRSIGLEVNPFTSFLSDTKIKSAKVKDIRNWKVKLFKSVEKGALSPLLGYSTFSKRKNLSKWLFNDSVLNAFEGGWRFTNSIPAYNVRKLFKLSLIASAMQNCNATKDGKCLRYN